jgi:hypothetical protein
MATRMANGDLIGAQSLSTRELIGEITAKASLLARKEIELAKTEIKADLHSQLTMAKSLAIAAVAALLGLNLLLVSLVQALALYVAPWLGALLLGGALLVLAGILGYVGWSRRVSMPLALTRKTLKEGHRHLAASDGPPARRGDRCAARGTLRPGRGARSPSARAT